LYHRYVAARGLDEYYAIEEDLLTGKGDTAAVMGLLQVRLALFHDVILQSEHGYIYDSR
jgi:hypothetical protein